MTSLTIDTEIETISPVLIEHEICDLCGSCVGVCPVDCIELSESRLNVISEDCIKCWLCIPACPLGALEQGE
ncbi:MAG: 4Fe-4S binding protein [Calditrichaeota bacterium]|nr:4Fe-4S binding protein [Calditrichota bacterium]